MGLFSRQFKNVVEWNEVRDDVIFYKWKNNEIKKIVSLLLSQDKMLYLFIMEELKVSLLKVEIIK